MYICIYMIYVLYVNMLLKDHLVKVKGMVKKLNNNSNKQQLINFSHSLSSQDDILTSSAKLRSSCPNFNEWTQNRLSQSLVASTTHKLMRLSEAERLAFGTNVLEYWRKPCGSDKQIMELVQTIIVVPVTQVSVERSFSALFSISIEPTRQPSSRRTIFLSLS